MCSNNFAVDCTYRRRDVMSPVPFSCLIVVHKKQPFLGRIAVPSVRRYELLTITMKISCDGNLSETHASNVKFATILSMASCCDCFMLVFVKIVLYLKCYNSLFLLIQVVFYYVLRFSEKLN